MGRPIVILPPFGKLTGIYSAKVDMPIKKINTTHVSENEGKVGIKYIKRVIANTTTIPT